MNVKINRKDASGWVGATVKVRKHENPDYVGQEGVVTNSLPASDGSVWSLHVRLTRFPEMKSPLIFAPDEVERQGLTN
jgi:hypothetical protein